MGLQLLHGVQDKLIEEVGAGPMQRQGGGHGASQATTTTPAIARATVTAGEPHTYDLCAQHSEI